LLQICILKCFLKIKDFSSINEPKEKILKKITPSLETIKYDESDGKQQTKKLKINMFFCTLNNSKDK
jgi:hypothetical protein